MSKNKMTIIIWIIVMVSIIIWSVSGILDIRRNQEPFLVSVIVDDSYSDRWLVAKSGLEQAAEDNNIIMNYVYTSEFASVYSQLEAIKRETDNGADGIIVQWISSDVDMTNLNSILQDKPIVMLESDIATEGMYPVCSVNNYELGRSAAQQIIDDLYGRNDVEIGIFAGNEELVSTGEQLEGVRSVLQEYGINERWILYNNEQESADRIESRNMVEPVDILLLLGSNETDIGIDYIVQNEDVDTRLYGAGCSQKSIYYLDKQVLRSLVVPDEFNLGYLSMQAMADRLEYHAVDSVKTEILSKVVSCDEIHKKENENLLFPIVQ